MVQAFITQFRRGKTTKQERQMLIKIAGVDKNKLVLYWDPEKKSWEPSKSKPTSEEFLLDVEQRPEAYVEVAASQIPLQPLPSSFFPNVFTFVGNYDDNSLLHFVLHIIF